jgi:hypothetical protein
VSVPGEGTAVTIRLPASAVRVSGKAEAASA